MLNFVFNNLYKRTFNGQNFQKHRNPGRNFLFGFICQHAINQANEFGAL